jgi:hypothetical protein
MSFQFGSVLIGTERMTTSSSSPRFKERVVLAFLVVPWLPLLIFVPYVPKSESFRLFGWDEFGRHVVLCFGLAIFTYILEVIVLLPVWLLMLRKGKTSFLQIVVAGFLVALTLSLLFLSGISGQDFLFEDDLRGVMFLIWCVGASEAAVFWLIVRPDKYAQIHNNSGIKGP